MARIHPISGGDVTASVEVAFEHHRTTYGARITNMKATLAHSLVAFEVYMEWYRLYERVKQITGERVAYLFAYSISQGSGCPLCTTFFRKIIIDHGEQPEDIRFTTDEQALMDLGSAMALGRGKVPDTLFHAVSRRYTTSEMVDLLAFAGQMVATNIFANATETDIDDYLQTYLSFTDKKSDNGQ